MENKNLLPFAIAWLTAAFVLVSILVTLTRGRNSYLLNKKLRIGALLLTLTAATSGVNCLTCYAPSRSEEVRITSCKPTGSHGEFILNLSRADTLSGTIFPYYSNAYSFQVTSLRDSIIQQDNLQPLKGTGNGEEPFRIPLRQDIDSGDYYLKIFDVHQEAIPTGTPIRRFPLHIVHGDSL